MATLMEEVSKTLDYLRVRKKGYNQAFRSPAGQEVLADLAKFCRAHDTTFSPDPRVHALYEGRKEVWLRIQRHLNLTAEELFEIYSGRSIAPKEQTNG